MDKDFHANIGAFGQELKSKAENAPKIKLEQVPQRTHAFPLPHNEDP